MKKFRHNKGFTLIELLGVIVILGILITIGAVAVSTAIDSANNTKVRADLKNFDNAISYILTENPQLGRKTGYQNTDILAAYNESVDAAMKIDLSHCGTDSTLTDGGSTVSGIKDIVESTVVATYTVDPWGTPYKIYVQGNNLSMTGNNGPEAETPDAELRIFIISNGKNTIGSNSPNLLDLDDVCLVVEIVNGEVRSGYSNTSATDIETIHWFDKDYATFDTANEVDINSAGAVLNMNYACLMPVRSE